MREPIALDFVEIIDADGALPKGTTKAGPRYDACCISRMHADCMGASAERNA
ncbi:hypothetical protein [Burkholderia territorii]|uniref:hypothetical protein n=1 Tax=Burkholderia territorii TaxID=1503055 RepID=UPI000A485783|nr:hypothetical protein [Burkholderia territorii]